MTSRSYGVYGDDGEGGGPSAEAMEPGQPAHERRQNEVPVPVAISRVLARTEDVAVVLAGVQAHSTGFAFTLAVRLRRTPTRHHDVFRQVSGHLPSRDALLVGVQFADGRRGSSPGRRWTPPGRPGEQGGEPPVVLANDGGGGGGRAYDHSWWVSPLPPRGPLLFVVRWEAQGVPETVTKIDATPITDAGTASEQLWPWEPEPPQDEREEPPSWPADGWFAQ